MSSLLDRMSKAGTIKSAEILSESSFFTAKDMIPTDLPILNVAFSGDLNGGLVPGLTILAGLSKSFKTLLGLYCLKAYMNKYPDAVCLFYDSEFGVTPDYLKSNGIDATRVLHIPIEHVEQLKFDIVRRLEEIKRGDKVFIFVDSLGALASKKEAEDALEEKSVADMSRAKAIRSLLRIITPHLTMKDLPCVVINHVYSTMELYSKTVIPGGTAVTYSANQIFVISKSQEKDGTELIGYNFTINIEKSRFVREKSKLPFTVTYEDGIQKYSGLLDIALESGHVIKPSNGWYQRVDKETGEVSEDKFRAKNTLTKDFWESILKSPSFNEFVKSRYQLGLGAMMTDDEIAEEFEDAGE
jgi:RecA/RadA recombinase